jgi:hypothetical protein
VSRIFDSATLSVPCNRMVLVPAVERIAARSAVGSVEAHMVDPVQVSWSPAGSTMPSLDSRALADITDGDTPNVRMPIRMLSVDTPETTARSQARAAQIDEGFGQLAMWIREGRAPVEARLAEFLLPKLETGVATPGCLSGTTPRSWHTNSNVSGCRRVSVVAHSRGGLVARHAAELLAARGGPEVELLTPGTLFLGTPIVDGVRAGLLGVRVMLGGLRVPGGFAVVDSGTRLAGLLIWSQSPPGSQP